MSRSLLRRRAEMPHVTLLRFGGGETVKVELSLAETQRLVQRAMASSQMFELHAPDGRVLVVNPQQIQYLQDAAAVEADANWGESPRSTPAAS